MTKNESKPREFWITDNGGPLYDVRITSSPTEANSIHAIEYSAYDQALAKIAELEATFKRMENAWRGRCEKLENKHWTEVKQLRESLKEAVRLIEFYHESEIDDTAADSGGDGQDFLTRLRDRHPEVFSE